MNNLVWIVLDSCRYDSFLAAETRNFTRIGTVEKRYSYASWTSPSHHTYLIGMIPHTSPTGVFASHVYREEFKKWGTRLGAPEMTFKEFAPELNLVKRLKELGYRTIGKVSLPVLNPKTTISTHFDKYELMEDHNDFNGIVAEIEFSEDQPYFYFLNIGETHYPYMLDEDELPRLQGVHGVLKKLDDFVFHGGDVGRQQEVDFFTHPEMDRLRKQQVKAVRYCDEIFGRLLNKAPPNTYFIITADHGELFGEDGYFGHGPVMHEKVFEVPFIEGFQTTDLGLSV